MKCTSPLVLYSARIWDKMERVKKELFLTYFSIDPILDVSAGSVEIHFHLALLSEVKKKAVFCIRPVSFHDSHQHTINIRVYLQSELTSW